jgi:hypothetical protein
MKSGNDRFAMYKLLTTHTLAGTRSHDQPLTFLGVSDPLVPLLLLGPPFFYSEYSFLVHRPINLDDRNLLAHAMASDFTVTWQYIFSKRTIVFFHYGSKSTTRQALASKSACSCYE